MENNYLPRFADNTLKEKLEAFKAVYIAGPKWCGKTSTAERQAKSALYMQDPDSREANLLIADTKPSLLLDGELFVQRRLSAPRLPGILSTPLLPPHFYALIPKAC